MMSKAQIEKLVYQCTPIDIIISANEFQNGIEVRGYKGNQELSFNFYNNGQVVQNDF